MAIQHRRGQLANFDRSKMLPGEIGVSIDNDNANRKAFMTFSSGVVKEFAFKGDLQPYFFVDFTTGHLMFGDIDNYIFDIDTNSGHLMYDQKGI